MRKLMFDLDRKSLEIIYTSFIRPLLEYADVIWDNCTNYEKEELDKIQNEAARICCGATKLVSINKLSTEIGWESLQTRRTKHKLILFYKMVNGLSPPYLTQLVPQTISSQTPYPLRNRDDINVPFSRTNTYFNSFIPSVVREWNALSHTVRSATTLSSFKNYLNVGRSFTPSYYYSGNRKAQILHVRLRTKCSGLNEDLFSKGVVDSAICDCGMIESSHHYFFVCSRYQRIRNQLFTSVSQICPITLKNLLFGDETLSHESNTEIFNAVQRFITESKRFT